MDPVSVDTTNQPAPTVSVDTGNQSIVPNPETAAIRAAKASYGLQGMIPNIDYNTLLESIQNGEETEKRRQLASELDLKAKYEQLAYIQRMLADGKMTPQAIASMNRPGVDPQSVFEQTFSRRYINSGQQHNEGSWLEEAMTVIPEYVETAKTKADDYNTKNEIIRKNLEDINTLLDQQSYVGYGVDFIKTMFPGYTEYKERGNVPGVGWFDGILRGNNKEDQRKELYNMPLPQFLTTVKAMRDRLDSNPQIASDYFKGMLGMSLSDQSTDNLFSLIDIATLVGSFKFAPKLAKSLLLKKQTDMMFKSLIQSAPNIETQPVKVVAASAAGDLGEAAVQKVASQTVSTMAGKANMTKDAIESLQTVLQAQADSVKANVGNNGQELANRISENTLTVKNNLFNMLSTLLRVNRITAPLATEEAVKAIKESIKNLYPGISNAILDIGDPIHEPITNTWHVPTYIGQFDATLFSTTENADAFAKLHGLAGYTVEQQGKGFAINMTRPLRETDEVIRDNLLKTAESKFPDSWLNAFITRIRTPEETMAMEQRLQRKIATYAPSQLMSVMQESAKEIAQLAKHTYKGTTRKKMWDDWVRVVEAARTVKDPMTGEPGYFFKTQMGLEYFYQQTVKRVPTAAEVKAYFSYVRTYEIDRILRNVNLYKSYSRLGAESHRLWTIDPVKAAHIAEEDSHIYSNWFNGIIQNHLPGSTADDTMLVMSKYLGKERLHGPGQRMSSEDWKDLEDGVKKGQLKVIEVVNPEYDELHSFSKIAKDANSRVRWVVTDSAETQPLPFDLIPRRGGGHFDYDFEHYIKQAKIRPEKIGGTFRHWYEGDTTVMPISIRAMGKDIAKKLDAVREALKAGDEDAAKIAAKELPIDWKEINGWFKPSRAPSGEILPPRLNLNEPFQVVPRNKMIADVDNNLSLRYKGTFEDGTKKGSVGRLNTVQYAGQRDAYEVNTISNEQGTRANPLYNYEPARMVDPIQTMNRALSKIVQSTWMDDYKIQAVEHWMEEAKLHLNATPEQLRYSPFYYFHNLDWKPGVAPEIKRQLLSNWYKIRQFTGVASETDAFLNSAAQALADKVYNKLGGRAVEILPTWMLARTKDPIQFTRSVVFNMKMGLFSIPQFMVHLMTYVNVMGIAGPINASKGMSAAMMHGFARLNKDPAILDHFDTIASKMGWRPGEWKEAFEQSQRTGFFNEPGTYALRDDIMSNRAISRGIHKFLDAGHVFFRSGVQSLRAGSWYTAFKEFRDLHPTGKLTNDDVLHILERADILSHNMTRASNSLLHTGVMSIPMQFATYFLRLTELMTGSRLTWLEKARLFGVNAAIFGFPMATGLSGIPFDQWFRESARQHGYVVGDNFLKSVLMEGVPSAIGAVISGGGDPSKGNWYNWGERYGPKAPLEEVLQSDETFWKLIGGATGVTVANGWNLTSGLRMALSNMLTGNYKDFKLKSEDFTDVLKEVASANNAWRYYAMLNLGQFLSKNEATVKSNISVSDASWRFLTGLTTAEQSDLFPMGKSMDSIKSYEHWTEQQFQLYYRRSIRASDRKDPEQANDWLDRAFKVLEMNNYPIEKRAQLLSTASKGLEDVMTRIPKEYYVGKSVPEDKKESFMNAYDRVQQRQQ